MSVGIFTFHFVDNYGAVLQVYALQKVLSSYGIEAEIVDYRPPYINNQYKVSITDIYRHPRKFLNSIIHSDYKKSQHSKFSKFSERYVRLSSKLYTKLPEDINDSYDYFICGSDQIWNPIITGYDTTYFLDFVKDPNKKIAYAASIGKSIDDEVECFVLENTKYFNKISVREEQVAQHFNNFRKSFRTVIDPTMLLSSEQWIEIESKPNELPDRYILVYDLENRKDILNLAQEKARKEKLKLITIHPLNKSYHGHLNLGGVGPSEFIYLFRNAEYVFTNSFHGLVYSTIFDKKVYVINHSSRNSRLENLIESLELMNRDNLEIEGCKATMYTCSSNTKKHLMENVGNSIEFLLNSLEINKE